MQVNLQEIFSPQTAFAHVVWDFIYGGIILKILQKINKWFKEKPITWKRRFWLLTLNLAGIVAISYISAQILWQVSGHVSQQISSSFSQPKPELSGVWVTTGAIDEKLAGYAGITVKLQIYNNSLAPSIVKNWHLDIKTIDGVTIPAPVWNNAAEAKISFLGSTNIILASDFLPEKTRFTPIQPGSMQDGYVAFIVAGGGSVTYLTAAGTKYELKFQDVNNKEYKIEIPIPSPTRK